jgi:2-polyprenyl-3-methyl-5-hydroxy-6-metoxy-1,4-benzoquinol methylase
MAVETRAADYYDRYWSQRDLERAAARSRARARIALELLGPSRGRLLEVGCGPGWALESFRDAGFEARGIDVSARAVELARARGLDAEVLDLLEAPGGEGVVQAGGFDVVAALEVLEHVEDSLGLLRRALALVRPGGSAVVSLPNEFHCLRRLAMMAGRPGFGGHDDPHVRHFDVRSAARLFAAADARVERSGWDGLCPPRFGVWKRLLDPLARLSPSLFAIAGVHRIRP